MKTFKLLPVQVGKDFYEVSHIFTDGEIMKLLLMPKIGKRLTFCEAYSLRWHELSYKGNIFNYSVLNMSLEEFCSSRGYYIEFEEGELRVNEYAKIQH